MLAPISIKFRNLTKNAQAFSQVIGREMLFRRLIQSLLRPVNHHVAIIGEPGIGKTSLIEMLALAISEGAIPHLPSKVYELETAPILSLLVSGDNPRTSFEALRNNITELEEAIIVIEDIQLLAVNDPNRLELTIELFQAITANPKVHLIVTTTDTAFRRTFYDDYVFNRLFTPLTVSQLDEDIVAAILEGSVANQSVEISDDALNLTIELGNRYGHGRTLPDAALRLLEEVVANVTFDNRKRIEAHDVQTIISEREGVPMTKLDTGSHIDLSNLESKLSEAVIGQPSALKTIARTVINAEIGLGDESKPRGSFLLLGPSGVGKTETAKALTAQVYHDPKAMVRLDMSEYSEAHSAVRLTGSPPGYVGYEEGGQLTGAVDKQPYSLVLLDEIEKAHPKLFDVFLQLLDDGRLTDSSGKTVDFTHSMVLATSNIGSQEITVAAQKGIDVSSQQFIRGTLMPLLLKSFRPEFINRFDAVLVYQPLAIEQLVSLAQRELRKLEQRLASRQISFDVPDDLFKSILDREYDPLFGARPIKRLVANHFEMPIAEQIVNGSLKTPVVIDGSEPWLGL